MTTYTRTASCTQGHRIDVSFTWDPDETTGGPGEYLEPCPVSGCDGRVAGKLPIGADANTLKLTGPR